MRAPAPIPLTRESLMALSALANLDTDKLRAEELLPLVQKVREGARILSTLDLTDVDPAVGFQVKRAGDE